MMDQFFFVESDIVPPPKFEHLFPSLDSLEQYDRLSCGFLFSCRLADMLPALPDPKDAATLTFSRNGYRKDEIVADASSIYKVLVEKGLHRIEHQLEFESPVKPKGRIFNSDDVEAIAAYEAQLSAEAAKKERALAEERALDLLAVKFTTADDLIAFAKLFNPHHIE